MKKHISNTNIIITTTTVTNIIEHCKLINNKFKTVFECKNQKEKPTTCIYWERSSIAVGDTVQLTGRFKNDVFLVWKILILKRGQTNE